MLVLPLGRPPCLVDDTMIDEALVYKNTISIQTVILDSITLHLNCFLNKDLLLVSNVAVHFQNLHVALN